MNFLLALLLAIIPQPPNTVVVGPEGINITAVSNPSAQMWFGIGTTYCATPANISVMPLFVSYTSVNPALCATDPAPNVVKQIVAQQQATAYTVTYTSVAGKVVVVSIPALPPPTLNCTGTATMPTSTSNGTITVTCK